MLYMTQRKVIIFFPSGAKFLMSKKKELAR